MMQFATSQVNNVFKKVPFLNDPVDVIDKKIPERSNGLMLIGDYKKDGRSTGGRYMIRGILHYERGEAAREHFSRERFFESISSCSGVALLKSLYDFVFHPRIPKAIVVTKPREKNEVTKPRVKNEVAKDESIRPTCLQVDGFILDKFLKTTAEWCPGNEDYVTLCIYFAKQRLDPKLTGELCNKAWGYPVNDRETENMMNSADINRPEVNKGSIINMLRRQGFSTDGIFEQRYKYHNESDMFDQPRIWGMLDVEKFVTDVYSYTWGGGRIQFVYKEQRKERIGNKYFTVVDTVISDNLPFDSKKADKKIMVLPTFGELLKYASKFSKRTIVKGTPPELGRTILRTQTLLDNPVFLNETDVHKKSKQLRTVLGSWEPPAELKQLSALVTLLKQTGKLKSRYHSYTCVPFLERDITPVDCLNIFSGFQMQQFRNTHIDITKTKFWEWMFVAWSNREAYKMEYLLNYWAMKLQQPHRKIEKILVAFCKQTGVGKSACMVFISSIFGPDKVIFCKNMAEYNSEQNANRIGKLFGVLDDIDRLKGRKEADALKSGITATTFRMKKLYSDPVTLPSQLDLITTSNERSPIFVSSQNRRVELIVMNPELKGNTPKMEQWWIDFHKESQDHEICGAWFDFLAKYKITINVRSENHRFDPAALGVHKIRDMKIVHSWVRNFFSDIRCFEDACPYPEENWFDEIKFLRIGDVNTCRITKKRAYFYFTHWCSSTGRKHACKLETFIDDLEEIGIPCARKRMDNNRLRLAFTFLKEQTQKSLKCFYSVDDLKLSWCFSNDGEFSELKKGEWRFKKCTSHKKVRF